MTSESAGRFVNLDIKSLCPAKKPPCERVLPSERMVRGAEARPIRTKWASCSTNRILTFNRELLQMDTQLWDYVIAHELPHFDVPNHSKLWKSLMRAHV